MRMLSVHSSVLALGFLGCLLPSNGGLRAQAPSDDVLGRKVRVLRTEGHLPRNLVGRVTARDSVSLTVDVRGPGSVVVPYAVIRHLDVSVGQTRDYRKGMMVGFVVGAVPGFLFGLGGYCVWTCNGDAAIAAAEMGLIGAAVGGLLASVIPSDVWVPVATPAPAGTARLGLHLAW